MRHETPSDPFLVHKLDGPPHFDPRLDVPSIAGDVTERLLRDVESARGRSQVDPASTIHVLLGPPGYGKTHLFGRVAHQVEDDVLFLFVGAIEDVNRPLEHIRWQVVENAFLPRGDRPSPLIQALCALCRPSFLAYIDALPATLASRYAPLRERIEKDPLALLEIVAPMGGLGPFEALANSLIARFDRIDAALVRAVALGWSPAAQTARRWLRGESLDESEAKSLHLREDPPEPVATIRALTAILAARAPVILCLDQLDVLLKDPEHAPVHLSVDLMNILSSVPNLVIVLSCLKDLWPELQSRFNQAFLGRVTTHDLKMLEKGQSLELVRRRLATWPDRPGGREEYWPFDPVLLERYFSSRPTFPRLLIRECGAAFRTWLERGDLNALIRLESGTGGGGEGNTDTLEDKFRNLWDQALASIQSDRSGGLENVPDQRIARAIREATGLYQRSTPPPGWPVIGAVGAKEPVKQAGNKTPYRYSFDLTLKGAQRDARLVLALEAVHNPRLFSHYFDAVDTALQPGNYACFLTTKAELPIGPATRKRLEDGTAAGRLRVVSFQELRADFNRLMAFLTLLDEAEKGDLLIDGKTIDPHACRMFVMKLKVLDNLSLCQSVLGGWVEPPAVEDTVPPEAETVGSNGNTTGGSNDKAAGVTSSTSDSSPDEVAGGRAVNPPPRTEADDDRIAWAADREDVVVKTLADFNVRVRPKGATEIGPTFARFLIDPLTTPINRIRQRAEDLKIRLGVEAQPLVNSQAGAVSVDVQLPEQFRSVVRLAEVGSPPKKMGPGAPAWPVGMDVLGETHWLNFADSNDCHLLVAGTTGSGKSVLLKAMIASLARRLGPRGVRFILVDPKLVTFNFRGEGSPYLLRPVVHDAEEALDAVRECFEETERRFEMLQDRHLSDLSELRDHDPDDAPPRLVIVFDEFADLMADKATKKELEAPLKRLGAKARAAGVHLVLATQRPEASVVTPLLRSNLPSRICLRVASRADSRIILDDSYDGAALLGHGDLLWKRGAGLLRLQCPLVESEELEGTLFPAGVAVG